MSTAQTYASGSPPTAAWKGLPGSRTRSIKPLAEQLIFLAGPPGSGKTTLLTDIPESFGINADQSSIAAVSPKAVVWPDSGSLTLDEILTTVATLETLAAQKAPRPKTVWIDSVAGLMSLTFPWVVANARQLGLGEGKKHWRELNGKAAYDEAYGQVVSIIDRLQKAGYGVVVTGHIVNKVIPLGDDKSVIRPDFTFGPGLWSRLYWKFEMVAVMAVRWGIEKETTYIKEPQKDGTVKSLPRTRDITVKQHWVVFDDPTYSEIAKTRVPLSAIHIRPESPWQDFKQAYETAVENNNARTD